MQPLPPPPVSGRIFRSRRRVRLSDMDACGRLRLDARTADGDGAGEPQVVIQIADTGPGIPAHVLPSVCEPFFTTRNRGTGLGLAIARQIVEAHGGKIDVGERQGGGARFALRLPAAGGSAIAA